jgi:hypothetical protein
MAESTSKPISLLFLALLFFPVHAAIADDSLDAGFLADEFELTLDMGERLEILGPLFYHQQKETEEIFAVPPLFSSTHDPDTEYREFDFAYPILTYDRFGSEYRWQLIQLLSFSGGKTQLDVEKDRFSLFPFYFQQRSTAPTNNYTALVPIYGRIKQRFLRDEIFFVAFPAYSRTRKRDVVTDNFLYPFFHIRRGNQLQGWQFWPLVGSEHKGITWRTNNFGEAEVIGGHNKFFALWPIFFNDRTGYGTVNTQKTLAVLPLFNVQRSNLRDSTAILWPFFNFVDDREKKYRESQTPWPFIVFARGEGKTTSRVFPLFGRSHNATLRSDFYLWPLYKYNELHNPQIERERTRIMFFLYSHLTEKNMETQVTRRRTDFWPLFTSKKDFYGNTRLQLFAPIEPVIPNNKSVERNWSPLWSVWRSEKNPRANKSSQSLLWNLYRREKDGDDKKCSLLFGLFQYQSIGENKRVKLFYIPLGGSKARNEEQNTEQQSPN